MCSKKCIGLIVVFLIFVIAAGLAVYYVLQNRSATPSPSATPSASQIGLANPASVNCAEKGGAEETRVDANGGQYGVCKFTDGSECESWAFFRGECKIGDNKSK